MYGERNNDVRSCNHCCRGKSIRVTYSEYVPLALGIQHAPYFRVACPAVQYLSTLSHKLRDFRGKKNLMNIK